MNATPSLHDRRRLVYRQELDGIAWLRLLQTPERDRAIVSLQVLEVSPGDVICMPGQPVTHWLGLLEGLLKVTSEGPYGNPTSLAGVSPGGWLGEGCALRRATHSLQVQALRKSVVAALPIETFHWLLDHSIGFNRFIMSQLNERLVQLTTAREIDRIGNPDIRVARSLAALFNPVLFPGSGQVLRITQQELAHLVGLSRQRVNEALSTLEAQGAIKVEYGGVRVLSLEQLREGRFASAKRHAVPA